MADTQSTPASMSKKHDAPGTEKATDAAHEALDRLSQQAAQAEGRIRDMLDEARDELQSRAKHARARGEEAQDQVKDFVDENPLQALILAFLGGAIFAALFRR